MTKQLEAMKMALEALKLNCGSQTQSPATVAITALREAIEAADGYVLVPVEPTWDMKIAASTHYREPRDGHYTARMECAADAYRAMLAAAPKGGA